MQGEEDKDVVWGIVNDGCLYYRVNAREPKAPIGRGQKQLSLRVDLPHHELISRLQQVEEKPAVDLYKLQHCGFSRAKTCTVMSLRQQRGKVTTLSTSKLHHTPSTLSLAAER